MSSSCNKSTEDHCHQPNSFDYLLWISLTLTAFFYGSHLFLADLIATWPYLPDLASSIFHLMNKMWWGLLLGIVFVGLLGRVPREFVTSLLGKHGTFSGILRATLAGLLLDLCNHGILLIGMKLYERGASLGQLMAFLIASPWNSFSMTVILWSLVGLRWTLIVIALSAVVAVVSGIIFELLVAKKILPSNPHHQELQKDFRFWQEAKKNLSRVVWSPRLFLNMTYEGLKESTMILRWIFFGIVLAAAVRTFVPTEIFHDYFGPTLLGLGLTLVAATVIEVCSEGSIPLASEFITRAGAPGNTFAFLMTGVSTDYTEIMALKETTKSWKIALFLPLVTVPQVVILALALNQVHY